MAPHTGAIDPRSGFCRATSVFHSKRSPIPLPSNPFLDASTFISSQPHFGRIALIDASSGRQLTYSDLWSSVASLSSALSSIPIKKGDVILVLSPNSIHFPVICLAALSIGAIITTTNPLNTPSEIAKQISDSKPVIAFVISSLLPKITQLNPNLPIVLIDGDAREPGTLSAMLRTPATRIVREVIHHDDTATLLYSSGTTGPSKGVSSSHRNLIAMVATIAKRFNLDHTTERRFICTVPMFHIFGLAAFATGLLASGSTIIVLPKFELTDLFAAIETHKATDLPLVPPILTAMVNNAKTIRSKYNLSSLKWVLSGGAPMGKETIEGFVKHYPSVAILQGYGLTESTGIGASTDDLNESLKYGTAGLLSPSMEAMIVEPETGRLLGVNSTGELWLRGPQVMKGYFHEVEATASTLTSEGWLKTGDLCYIDEDGFIFVVDRLKELIKYKGYQVAPAELESVLLSHPRISEAAVIPCPDKDVGQYPMAYVVRKGADLREGEVMEFVAKQVAPYKRIRRVCFISEIPKNASGKILRKDLVKLLMSKM